MLTKRQRSNRLTKAYGEAVNNLCKAADRMELRGTDYLTSVTNDGIWAMTHEYDRPDMYPILKLDVDTVISCDKGEFRVCRERLEMTLKVLEVKEYRRATMYTPMMDEM